jgi:IS4 transposase
MSQAVRETKVTTEAGKLLRVISNDLDAPASEIAALYKRRWMIELCFRWIKQPLKLRHFYGTSENAVRNQITVALIAFVLIKLAHAAQGAVASSLAG